MTKNAGNTRSPIDYQLRSNMLALNGSHNKDSFMRKPWLAQIEASHNFFKISFSKLAVNRVKM